MKPFFASVVLLLASVAANGETIYSQLPGNPPGGARPSQLWFDPTGQNNLDSDAIAYDNFSLSQAKTISHVEWWGEVGPSVGYFIGFYNQDPNTTAMQPDLPQFHGHSPLAYETVSSYTQTAVGSGMYHFSADLPTPVSLSANTPANPRYFVAIIDSMPTAFATWGWAQGFGGDAGGTFYFLRGSTTPYSQLPDDRAFVLGNAVPEPATVWLLGSGLAALCVLIWRRMRVAGHDGPSQ